MKQKHGKLRYSRFYQFTSHRALRVHWKETAPQVVTIHIAANVVPPFPLLRLPVNYSGLHVPTFTILVPTFHSGTPGISLNAIYPGKSSTQGFHRSMLVQDGSGTQKYLWK